MKEKDSKQLSWLMIALIAFNIVWGLGNVVNNFAQQGIVVITSWILLLIIYFIPYTLMVGQLGSTFKDSEGGVSDWIKFTSTKQLAFFCGLDLLGCPDTISGSKTSNNLNCSGMGLSGKWTDFGKSVHSNDCLPFFTNFPTPFVYFNQGFESLEIFGDIGRRGYVGYVGSFYYNGCRCAID